MDYETLKVIWWGLVLFLLVGFVVMDGFDLGVGMLLPVVGKTDDERRVLLNSVGPVWEGNQVWLIAGAGTLFAAWPLVYAAAFSALYVPFMFLLFGLFLRPVGFDYRSKVADVRWRTAWDWGIFVGSAVPALVFGVAFGNIILGVPFHFVKSMLPVYSGSFWALFSPFAVLAGIVSLSMLVFHGANYLILRTDGDIQHRARRAALLSGFVMLVSFAAGGFFVAEMPGFVVTSSLDYGASLNPLDKTVIRQSGAWL